METEQNQSTVYVTNISPSVNEKTVSEFFSFCGKIQKLILQPGEVDSQEAIVYFETDSAAKTALLLSNALIGNDQPPRPIGVSLYNGEAPQTKEGSVIMTSVADGGDIPIKHDPNEDHTRSKTSVIASLAAAGYVLGDDCIQQAKAFDATHSISTNAQAAAEIIKEKVVELDEKLGISTNLQNAKNIAEEKMKEIDQQYEISNAAKNATETAKMGIGALATTASQNPTIARMLDSANSMKTDVTQNIDSVRAETQKIIDEKKQENAQNEPQVEMVDELMEEAVPEINQTAQETIAVE